MSEKNHPDKSTKQGAVLLRCRIGFPNLLALFKTPNRRRRRRRIALASLAVLFLALGATYGAYWATIGRFEQSTDDAYVAGNQIAVMAQEQGTVVAVLADDTTRVHRGQVLIRLDDSDARIALAQAKAKLATTVRQVNALYATEKQLQARLAKQQASLSLARSDYSRNKSMHKLGYYSTQNLQHSGTLVTVDIHSLAAAKQALQGVRAELGDTDVAGNPKVRLAAARVRSAWLALKRTQIVAPVSGYVARRSVQVGEDIAPGTPLMAIVPTDRVWVEANFKESALGSIHVGQPVSMHADAYGSSVTFHGRVIGIGAGTGSVFSLLPPQNATGNWIKVVQRVPIRIGIAKADLDKHPLRIGLSMGVTIDTRRGAHDARRKFVDPGQYKTAVYKTQDDGVNQIIARIITDNTTADSATTVAAAKSGRGTSHGE